MIYEVRSFDGARVDDRLFRCPTYSRQHFEQKKRLGQPCILTKTIEGCEPVVIDSFQHSILNQHIKATKEVAVSVDLLIWNN